MFTFGRISRRLRHVSMGRVGPLHRWSAPPRAGRLIAARRTATLHIDRAADARVASHGELCRVRERDRGASQLCGYV